MQLVYSREAYDQLDLIWQHIAKDNPRAADDVISRIRQSVEILKDHPRLGAQYMSGAQRRLYVSGLPYFIYYEIFEDRCLIEIVTIFHTSRKPPVFD